MPKMKSGQATEKTLVLLTPDTKARIQQATYYHGISESDLVRRAIAKYLDSLERLEKRQQQAAG